jgi:hypothetical protein
LARLIEIRVYKGVVEGGGPFYRRHVYIPETFYVRYPLAVDGIEITRCKSTSSLPLPPVVPSSRSRSVQLLQLAVFSLLLGSLLTLLDLVKVLHELRNLVILVCLLLAGLTSSGGLTSRKGGVGLGELAQGSEGVWAELVEDSGNELGQVFVGSVAVDGEGVGARRGVDCEGGGCRRVSWIVVLTKSSELATAVA